MLDLHLKLLIMALGLGTAITLGFTPSIPSILLDGNTKAWFDMASSYITKDVSDRVSQWDDRSGEDNHLLQANASYQPLWSSDGVLFDGVDEFMKCVSFTLNQPEYLYAVLKQITYGSDYFFDGDTSLKMLVQQTGGSPNLGLYGGAALNGNSDLAIDTWGVMRALFNSTSSRLQIDNNSALIGDGGINNAGGFTLGCRGDVADRFANIEVKEIIIRNVADSIADSDIIYNYLKNKYSL